MRNVVGSPAQKDDFFPRPDVTDKIWNAIETGSHVLIAAPRRVGKTSIMFRLHDKPKHGHAVVYVTTESADSENEFWQKLFNALIDEEFIGNLTRYSKKISATLQKAAGSIKKISAQGIEFGDGSVLEYYPAFEAFIKKLELEKKLVIMIDEFPQTVENIIEYEDEKSARSFLKTNRELRQNPKIREKVIFIYTGSIGLEGIATKLKATKFINDLNNIKVQPLDPQEAHVFVKKLTASLGLSIKEDTTPYLFGKIKWLIPFYIQLIMQEISGICKSDKTAEISEEIIDRAIHEALGHKNHFEHWHTRLKIALEPDAYKCAKEILNIASEQESIDSAQIANIAAGHDMTDDGKEVVHTLVYDGYINNDGDVKQYRFNSPILRMWWEKNVAN